MADIDLLRAGVGRTAWFKTSDACAGFFFAAVGALALYVGHDYPVGTSLEMGPGYFPTALGALLILLGTANAARAFLAQGGRSVGPLAWRPWLLVPIGVLLFGLMIDRLGLILGLVTVVLVSRIGGRALQTVEIAAICIVLAVIAGLLFTYGLGLPFTALLPH